MMTSTLNSVPSMLFSLFKRKPHMLRKDPQERPKLEEFISPSSFHALKSFTGFVTSIHQGEGVINNEIYFSTESHCIAHFKIGDCVQGEATQQNEHSAWRAIKVYLAGEDWEEQTQSGTDSFDPSMALDKFPTIVTGRVTAIYGDKLVALHTCLTFYANENNCSFKPIIGDWVHLAREEMVKSVGTFAASRVLPLRQKVIHGCISHIKSTFFVINGEIFCQKFLLPKLAKVRDRVVAEVIESDQAPFNWRAINVWIDEAVNLSTRQDSTDFSSMMVSGSTWPLTTASSVDVISEELFLNKYDIVVAVDSEDIILESTGFSRYVVMTLENGSDDRLRFLENVVVKAVQAEAQLRPDCSVRFPLRLDPKGKVSFVLSCCGNTVGTSLETVIFECRTHDNVTFKIGRQVKVVVVAAGGSQTVKDSTTAEGLKGKNEKPRRNWARIIRGEKPFHASPFLPVKLPHAEVPLHLWEAVWEEEKVFDVAPCLAEPLTIHNYIERFSFLLFFEEIAMELEMRKFDMPCTAFAPHGEFLSLTVEGLSENRPSLMVGDAVVASHPSTTEDCGGVKYEGVIHQVLHSKVLLKFHPNFHAEYRGEDYAVELHLNRTPSKRCHLAISQVVSQLGSSVLFPSKLGFQLPQIPFLDSGFKNHRHPTLAFVSSPDLILPTTAPTHPILPTNNHSSLAAESSVLVGSTKSAKWQNRFDWNLDKKEKSKTLVQSTTTLEMRSFEIGTDGYCLPVLKSQAIMTDPARSARAPRLIWFNKDLNLEQRAAVKRVLEGSTRPLPYVIFGPPGTGKTVTVVEAFLQIYKMVPHSRILVVCPSNSASDLIVERAVASGRLKTGEIVRINAFNRRPDSVPDEVKSYCVTIADIQSVAWHRILVTTATTAGVLSTAKLCNGHFTHVFIDEAGQLIEPEADIALGLVNSSSGQIVLAGDPKQLGPIVMSPIARRYGLNQSLLHRLCSSVLYQPLSQLFRKIYSNDDGESPDATSPTEDVLMDATTQDRYQFEPRLVTFLVRSYRSHPDLLELPSLLFYRSCLLPSGTSPIMSRLLGWEDLPNPTCPLVFHPVRGENMQEGDSPSWFNPAEAFQVSRYSMSLLKFGLQPSEVGIIAPYRKQVEKIRQLLGAFGVEDGIKVGSVEEFQGQEKLAVIVSTVRSSENLVETDVTHNLGFVRSAERFNVAITRAIALLVVIGNPDLLSADKNWSALLAYCVSKGAVKK